jgi:hypothetical protein
MIIDLCLMGLGSSTSGETGDGGLATGEGAGASGIGGAAVAVLRVQKPEHLPVHLKQCVNRSSSKKGSKGKAAAAASSSASDAVVTKLVWSMDCTQLLAVYGDGTCWVWDLLKGAAGGGTSTGSKGKQKGKQQPAGPLFVEQTHKVSPLGLGRPGLALGPANFCRASCLELDQQLEGNSTR